MRETAAYLPPFLFKGRNCMNIPKDPAILLSYINTKLRDRYASFDELCDDLEINRDETEKQLAAIGYVYSAERNAFV